MIPKFLPLVVGASLLAVSCGRRPAPGAAAEVPPAAEVALGRCSLQPLILTEDVTATVRAKTRAVLEAKVSGRILSMDILLGQAVKEGETLAALDDRELRARVESAEATFTQASRDEQRLSALVASSAISKADYDAAKARLDVAAATLAEARTMLDHARVTAPFDGLITRKLADQGDLAAPGKPLLELEKPGHLQVVADIPEALIGKLSVGMELDVRDSERSLRAKVAELSPAGDPNSRTFPVKLDLPAGSGMRPGQFVRLAVPVREHEALLIPAEALVVRGQMEMVFVNRDGRADMRLVRSGRGRNGTVEISAGLEGGEEIVVRGATTLLDGQPLDVKP